MLKADGTSRAGPSQKTRFGGPSRLSQVWTSVKTHLTPPSHPSTTSESAIESSFHTDVYYTGSTNGDGHLPLELLNPKSGTISRYKRYGGKQRNKPQSSAGKSASRFGDDDEPGTQYEPVNHIVVDTDFDDFTPKPAKSDSGSTNRTPRDTNTATNTGVGESGGHLFGNDKKMDGEDDESPSGDRSDGQSIRRDTRAHWIQRTAVYELIVGRLWPNIRHFLDSSFPEASKEKSYQKEAWFTQKQGAILGSMFYLISWCLTVGLLPKPLTKYNWYAYLGIGGFFTLPVTFMIIFDMPRRNPWLYQPFLLGATWVMADILIVEMWLCGFFGDVNHCGTRNFINLLGVAFAQPVLAILTLRQNRWFSMIGAIQWLIFAGCFLMYQPKTPKLFYRNTINFVLFNAFILGISFLRERSDRQMFALRQQLKIQYRATQSAQVMERRASDSKKRFVSYIFHEVRVPLNTALLAVQNLDGENVFKGLHQDQGEMVHGLMGSLTMMEKVLNDVLSFNRMESGKFTQARKPFEFHKSIQLVALSHRVQAQMAGIELIVELDKDIDKIGGKFVGDEMRLRQVASNLVSNSIKFTETGSVRIVTKLLFPRLDPTPSTEIDDPLVQAAINLQKQQGEITGDLEKGSVALEGRRMSRDSSKEKDEDKKNRTAVVRIEVHDTGVGLRKQDVIDNRLFSPYVQTEIGRRQGGKGSGLGLALVRQIVKLSNGRLGVESEFGKGSMFWFELPYALPQIKTRPKEMSSTSSPVLGRSPILGRPAMVPSPLVRIVESTPEREQHVNPDRPEVRPGMTMTESTMPLIPEAHADHAQFTSLAVPEETFLSDGTPSAGETTLNDPFSNSSPPRTYDWTESEPAPPAPERPAAERAPTLMREINGPASPALPLCTLVVDDDRLTRMLMSRMLTRLGHQVTTAENGKLALDMIRDSFQGKEGVPTFEVVFLDNQMPLMSGVEVAREVREMGCPLFIVGCTGNALREDQDEYLAAGADDIIPKPIHQKAVQEMIKEARKRVAGLTCPKEAERRGY